MAEQGQVISCHTVQQLNEHLKMSNQSKKLVVVDFHATWSGPCKIIYPVLEKLAKDLTNVIFLKVDTDELDTVAEEWGINAMPTFLLLKEGKTVDKVVGAKVDELSQAIENHLLTAAISN